MFIVNQDRNTTINMGNVKEISLHGKQIFADDTVIGKYGTEERTDQVYNEMLQTLFSPYMMLKDAELPPDSMKNFANGNVILLKSADREPDVKFYDNGCANCSLTKHSRDGNKLAEQGNEILEYSWYKSGQNPPAGKDRVMNLFNY